MNDFTLGVVILGALYYQIIIMFYLVGARKEIGVNTKLDLRCPIIPAGSRPIIKYLLTIVIK